MVKDVIGKDLGVRQNVNGLKDKRIDGDKKGGLILWMEQKKHTKVTDWLA